MDVVSIYICPLGALLAGIMFFWVMKKDTALAAVHEGRTAGKKDISGWFYPLGKWVYCAASLAALILGAIDNALASGKASVLSINDLQGRKVMRIAGGLNAGNDTHGIMS